MLNLDPRPADGIFDGALAGSVRTCIRYKKVTGGKAPSAGQAIRRCAEWDPSSGLPPVESVPWKNRRQPYFLCAGGGGHPAFKKGGGRKRAPGGGRPVHKRKTTSTGKSKARKTTSRARKATSGAVKRKGAFFSKNGRCYKLLPSGGAQAAKKEKCVERGLMGFRGAGGDGASTMVAILSGAGPEVETKVKHARHCTAVTRNRVGTCSCRSWGPGGALAGSRFGDLCRKEGLTLGLPPRKAAMAGSGLAAQAEAEFMADARPTLGAVPKTCKTFKKVYSEALGKNVKVCADFGEEMKAGLDGIRPISDGNLAGGLAKWYGLGQVGGGVGPAAGVIGGGLLAVLAAKVAPMIPGVNRLGTWAGLALAAAAAGAATLYPKTKQLGVGALMGLGALAVGVVLAKQMNVTLAEVVPDDLGGYDGWAGITPDEAAYEADAFGDDGGVNVLSSSGDEVDVLSAIDTDPLSGMGNGEVDVLSGAFGSLPFAGAI